MAPAASPPSRQPKEHGRGKAGDRRPRRGRQPVAGGEQRTRPVRRRAAFEIHQGRRVQPSPTPRAFRRARAALRTLTNSNSAGSSGSTTSRSSAAAARLLTATRQCRGPSLATPTRSQWEISQTARVATPGNSKRRCRSRGSTPARRWNSRRGRKAGCARSGTARAYGKRADKQPKSLPVVELQPDSYKHHQYGKIYVPQLHIVTWTDDSGAPLSAAADLDDEIPFKL